MKTSDSKDQGREAFEAAGITSRLSRSTEPGYTDEYEDSHTQFAWRGWQAALATSASALARDEASVAEAGEVNVFSEIVAERSRQTAQWGGASHDDSHSPEDFFGFMLNQMSKARGVADSVAHEIHHMRLSIDELGPKVRTAYRERLVKIAALSVAAIEAIDRIKRA